MHTDNFVWGRARNPYDNDRSCGGSSGGDAGLVASRCVPLAIGSDVGGSIRIPSAFNGVVGFKPTQGRITYRGGQSIRMINFDMFSGHLKCTVGPISKSVKDCIETMKILLVDDSYK